MGLSHNIIAVAIAALVAGCASTAVESQDKRRNPGQGRIYVLRPHGGFGPMNSVEVALNGQKIGIVAAGSYFFVDRPPGVYVMQVRGSLAGWRGTYDSGVAIEVAPGSSYYFEVGPPIPRRNIDQIHGLVMGITGRPAPECATAPLFCFYSLDPNAGAAKVAELKPAQAQ